MASDLERTLIAARYSSRELSKLLHGLFLPDEDPLVVVDSDDHKTQAMTGSTSASGSGQTGTGTSSGSRTSGGTRTSASRSTSTSHSTPGGQTIPQGRPTSPTASVTEPIPDVSELRGQNDSGAARLERVVQAEAGRLARKRMRRHLRVLAIVAGVAILVGGAAWAVKRYVLPVVLAPAPPPPPKPALPVPTPNQTAPEPAAKPVKKKTSHKKSHTAAPAGEPPPAPGDEPMPPSDTPPSR
jgi:hypothetical protein